MNNCLVTKLKAIVDNPNLPIFFNNYRDFAEARGGNTQTVQIVGAGLAVESFSTGTHKVVLKFKHGNTDGKDSFLMNGKNNSDGNRISFAAYGNTGSTGESSYIVKASSGSGIISTDGLTLTAGNVYTAIVEHGKCTVYNDDGTTFGTITLTSYPDTVVSLTIFNFFAGGNFNNTFTLLNVKVIDGNNVTVIDASPAVDNNEQGCLFDKINNRYYHANTGQLTVYNSEQ